MNHALLKWGAALLWVPFSLAIVAIDAIAQTPPAPAPAGLVDPNAPPRGHYVQTAPGLLSAPLFTSERFPAGTVDIADLLVGPRQRSQQIQVKVGALIQAHAGRATLQLNQEKRAIAPGDVVLLKPDDAVAIDNSEQPRPFVARLIRIGD